MKAYHLRIKAGEDVHFGAIYQDALLIPGKIMFEFPYGYSSDYSIEDDSEKLVRAQQLMNCGAFKKVRAVDLSSERVEGMEKIWREYIKTRDEFFKRAGSLDKVMFLED